MQYYVKTFRGSIIGGPVLLDAADPRIAQHAMLPCPTYASFDPATKNILSRAIVNNEVVFTFEARPTCSKVLELERQKKKKEIDQAFTEEFSAGVSLSVGFSIYCDVDSMNKLKNLEALMIDHPLEEAHVDDILGVVHILSLAQVQQASVELMLHCATLDQKVHRIKGLIDAATTIETIREINWQS